MIQSEVVSALEYDGNYFEFTLLHVNKRHIFVIWKIDHQYKLSAMKYCAIAINQYPLIKQNKMC